MAGYGIPHEEMVKLIPSPTSGEPIDDKTLRVHFRAELDRGMANANVRVMNGLFKNATTPTKIHPGGNPLLQIFWSKVRLGWQSGGRGAPTGAGVPPLPEHRDEQSALLEAARRIAFVITAGARQAAMMSQAQAPAPAGAQQPQKTTA